MAANKEVETKSDSKERDRDKEWQQRKKILCERKSIFLLGISRTLMVFIRNVLEMAGKRKKSIEMPGPINVVHKTKSFGLSC